MSKVNKGVAPKKVAKDKGKDEDEDKRNPHTYSFIENPDLVADNRHTYIMSATIEGNEHWTVYNKYIGSEAVAEELFGIFICHIEDTSPNHRWVFDMYEQIDRRVYNG